MLKRNVPPTVTVNLKNLFIPIKNVRIQSISLNARRSTAKAPVITSTKANVWGGKFLPDRNTLGAVLAAVNLLIPTRNPAPIRKISGCVK